MDNTVVHNSSHKLITRITESRNFQTISCFKKRSPSVFLPMSPPNFEKITSKVFPELEGDLVPYVASILEENKTATADELVEVLSPILTGYEVCSEEAIVDRCKKLPGMMHHKEEVKK